MKYPVLPFALFVALLCALGKRLTAVVPLSLALLLACGCEAPPPPSNSPLQQEEAEYILTVVLDLSCSFHELKLGSDGRAYRYVSASLDRFFRERMGSR